MANQRSTTPDASRRSFLMQGGTLLSSSALLGMVPRPVRAAAHAGGSEGLEKTKLTFGIIPLTDCAPIVIAKEKGYFERYGLDVTVSKEASWGED